MKATMESAGVKMTLEMSEEEAELLVFMLGYDLSIPEMIYKPTDPRRKKLETLLNQLHTSLRKNK